MSSFQLLHPNIQRKLWEMKWEGLHEIQDLAIRHLILDGGDLVIASPTASGKTEAAFLPVLSSIADAPTGSVRAMYVGPLKALINDQFRRVEDLCSRLEVSVCKWHGDVDDGPKKRLLARPSGVLLITPESLEALLMRRPTEVARLFAKLSFVVVDEMHAFMGTERGAQLVSLLHRIDLRAGCAPTRIGLSATLGDPEGSRQWLRPRGAYATLVEARTGGRALQLRTRGLWRSTPSLVEADAKDDAKPLAEIDTGDATDRELARAIALSGHGKTSLVFANAKTRIEVIADAIKTEMAAMGLPDEVVVHHGSLSRAERLHAEERLQKAPACIAVCSNTLELGIDIGTIDAVYQVAAPWSVASLVQRVGRSGRRDDAPRVLRCFFIADRPEDPRATVWDRLQLDFIQGLACTELMFDKYIEPIDTGHRHLSTVIHQSLSVLTEMGGTNAKVLYDRINGSGAFGAELEKDDFRSIIREMGRHQLVEQLADGTLVVGLRGEKLVEHYSFFAAFNAPEELRVVHGSDEIGTVADPPGPGEHLILAGRRWRVETIDGERREVSVRPAKGARPPKFEPSAGNVGDAIQRRMRALLLGDTKPVYLDGTAVEILDAARREAQRHAAFTPSAQVADGVVRMFVFGGAKVQRTLSLILSASGIERLDAGVGFDALTTPEEAVRVLRAFAANPDLLALAAHADRVLQFREMGPEKFDRYTAPEVWQRTYAREQLDAPGAIAKALELSDALTTRSPSRATVPASGVLPSPSRLSVWPRTVDSAQDLVKVVESLSTAPLPERLIIVPSEAHAHGLRRDFVRTSHSALLNGTRFASLLTLAKDVLHFAGIPFDLTDGIARSARVSGILREPPPLRYFQVDKVRTSGWSRAFVDTISELEERGLTPDDLFGSASDPRSRDLADIWRALQEREGASWSQARALIEAARVLERDPTIVRTCATLALISGHESETELRFLRALPRVTLAAWYARPHRPEYLDSLRRVLGCEIEHISPSATSRSESNLAMLKARFLSDPSRSALRTQVSTVRDGTVELELHDGVDAEIEAAVIWVQEEVTRGTALEDMAILVPSLDPIASLLVSRLTELHVPTHVVGGVPLRTTRAGQRMAVLLRASRSFLDHRALAELVGVLRVDRPSLNHLTVSEVRRTFDRIGFAGGHPSAPEGALAWPSKIAARVAWLDAQGRGDGPDQRELARDSELLRLVETPMRALVNAIEPAVRAGPLLDVWTHLERFIRGYVLDADESDALNELAERMAGHCADPSVAKLRGQDALALIDETFASFRAQQRRFGEPVITIATIVGAAGIGFGTIRVLGMAEGLFPVVAPVDAVLPTRSRSLIGLGLDVDMSTLRQLHALDLSIRLARDRVVLSSPVRDARGSERAVSQIVLEVAVALGRSESVSTESIHRWWFGPAHRNRAEFEESNPVREASLQRQAALSKTIPDHWAKAGHVDPRRGIVVSDPNARAGPLDGFFPGQGWFAKIPGFDRERPLSASVWQSFLRCPHFFLYEHVVGLRPLPEQTSDPTTDPATYGKAFHSAAQRFYEAHGAALAARSETLASLKERAMAVVDATTTEFVDEHPSTTEASSVALRRRLHQELLALVTIDWEAEVDGVIAVERAFGKPEPLPLLVDSQALYAHGFIDRVETRGGAGVVTDLKTGKPRPRSPGAIDPVIDAQLAMYALVAEALRVEWELPSRLGAAYVYPRGKRTTERSFFDAEHSLLLARGREWLRLTFQLGTGRAFPRTTRVDDCAFCAFTPVCGPGAQRRATTVLEHGNGPLLDFKELKRS